MRAGYIYPFAMDVCVCVCGLCICELELCDDDTCLAVDVFLPLLLLP